MQGSSPKLSLKLQVSRRNFRAYHVSMCDGGRVDGGVCGCRDAFAGLLVIPGSNEADSRPVVS